MRSAAVLALVLLVPAGAGQAPIPSIPLVYGGFNARFGADGVFTLEGQGWPPFKGTWKANGKKSERGDPPATPGCQQPGGYRFSGDASHVALEAVADACTPRRMILDHSA